MNKIIVAFMAILALTFACAAEAQQVKKIPRIGVLFPGFSATFTPRTEAFLQGLRELGYVEGKTITIEWRWTEDRAERIPELAGELVKLNLDLIVADSTRVTQALKKATRTIPVVMSVVGDPVGTGLVESLARPGGNLTGLSNLAPEMGGKRLELLKEVIPNLSRPAVMLNPTNPLYRLELQETLDAARALGLQIQPIVEVTDLNTLQEGFTMLNRDRVRAFLLFADAIFYSMRGRIIEYATKSRLPAMYFGRESVDDGGLMSYGTNIPDLYRRAAVYVEKILKGAKPADLPVEQPTKFEFIINLKAAKQISLTIPPNVLVRADKVIK